MDEQESSTPTGPGEGAASGGSESMHLPDLVPKVLATATASSARRAGHTLVPGAHAPLKQTLLALAAGAALEEHESPTAATVQVLHGRIRLVAGEDRRELAAGDFSPIPQRRHHVEAIDDSVVLLTVVQ